MKVSVNQEACIGCGACLSICGDVFDMNENGLSEVKVDSVPENMVESCKEALESCPTGAITEE